RSHGQAETEYRRRTSAGRAARLLASGAASGEARHTWTRRTEKVSGSPNRTGIDRNRNLLSATTAVAFAHGPHEPGCSRAAYCMSEFRQSHAGADTGTSDRNRDSCSAGCRHLAIDPAIVHRIAPGFNWPLRIDVFCGHPKSPTNWNPRRTWR